MKVSSSIVLWVLDYLTNRPQYVKLSQDVFSDVIFTNTGAPQGTVISPFLFSLYTAQCRATSKSCIIDKYADDTALVGLITKDDDSAYLREVCSFVDWCASNFLELNVSKTKEMLVDFRKKPPTPPPVVVNGEEIERVESYKYLGVVVNNTLDWTENTDTVMKKLNTRMYCLRKLKSFEVHPQFLQMFYSSVIGSVVSFGLTCWGGNLKSSDRERVDRVIRKAGKLIGQTQDDLHSLYHKRVHSRMMAIIKDETHPMWHDFANSKIERSGRFRVPKLTTERYRNTFFPIAIKKLNDNHTRSDVCTMDE